MPTETRAGTWFTGSCGQVGRAWINNGAECQELLGYFPLIKGQGTDATRSPSPARSSPTMRTTSYRGQFVIRAGIAPLFVWAENA